MDQPTDAPPPPAPHAPPERPSGPIPGTKSTWPKVIGVLLIVFGSVGLLQRFFGVVFVAIMPMLPLPPEAVVTGTLWVFGLVLSIVALPLAVVHLVAGIQTLRRRPSARSWVVAFFVYAVVILPPSTIYQYIAMQHQMQQAAQQGGAQPGMAAFGAGLGMVFAVLGALVALAYPTFLLIWFSRASIRHEVRSWGTAKGAA